MFCAYNTLTATEEAAAGVSIEAIAGVSAGAAAVIGLIVFVLAAIASLVKLLNKKQENGMYMCRCMHVILCDYAIMQLQQLYVVCHSLTYHPE